MARPPHARERVLDAFERILVEQGDRAATMDAVVTAAGVSKGGLLYHFPSKAALVEGLLDRLERIADEDLELMAHAPDGAVSYYLRTSVMEGNALDTALIAASRLAQGGSSAAADALRRTREAWADGLRPSVRDETALRLVMLIADGLYFNNALDSDGDAAGNLATPIPHGKELDELIALVLRSTR